MRKLTPQADTHDLPDAVRPVVDACLARWLESGVLGDPDLDEPVVLIEPGDTVEGIIALSSALAGLHLPDAWLPFEWVSDFGTCYEAGLILSDDGSGFSLIVPKDPGVPARLRSACAEQAILADPEG